MNSSIFIPKARFSTAGITYLTNHNPYMIAWWSAVFPGFGHYMLNQYIRATLLTLVEVTINTGAHINEAMVYSFCGEIELAKSTINIDWMLGYLIIYLITIGDSFRSTIELNKLHPLARPTIANLGLFPGEVHYLKKKKPLISALYSLLFPGFGQLYNHRIFLAFYAIFWWWVYILLSHAHRSIVLLLWGELEHSIAVLHPHWLLFMPSVIGGSAYLAHFTCRKHNDLLLEAQKERLINRYAGSKLHL